MQGVVQKLEYTKKGAKKFQISGDWFYAGRCKVDGLEVGSEIEFNFSEFGEDQGRGRLKSLEAWKYITRGQSQGSGYPQGQPSNAQNAANPPRVAQVVTITEVDVLRSVSNVVGSACAAGTVKTPEELEKWFQAAWYGLTRKPQETQKPEEPEFDDDIPF
jgi:hypothetical protein